MIKDIAKAWASVLASGKLARTSGRTSLSVLGRSEDERQEVGNRRPARAPCRIAALPGLESGVLSRINDLRIHIFLQA
jgi:hypothetical protein